MSLLNKKNKNWSNDNWMNESLGVVQSAEDGAGDNNKTPTLYTGNSIIANGADSNTSARVEKNQSNNLILNAGGTIDKAGKAFGAWTKGGFGLSETKTGQKIGQELTELGEGFKDFVGKTGEWMKDPGNMKKMMGYGAVVGSVYNYAQGQKSYDKTLDHMKKSIGVLTDTKTKISTDLVDNLGQLRSDSSELSQNTATDLITKNRSQLQQGLDSNVDFSSGVIKNIVDQSTKDINTKLASTFRNQQMKLDNLVDSNVTDARSSSFDIATSIKDVETEMDEVKAAKKNALRNVLTDTVAYGSRSLDPTGTMQKFIQSTKYKNEYT